MTSQQILHADLLDILFEHRNKSYGAYELRKTYNQQLTRAVVIALSSVFLVFFFFSSSTSEQPVLEKQIDDVLVTSVDMPEEPKPEPPKIQEPPKATPVKQQLFTDKILITDKELLNPLPPQDLLETAAVSNITTAGEEAPVFQPKAPVETNTKGSGENHEVVEKPKEIKPDKQPQFPGGIQAWIAFLNNNLRSPSDLESGEKRTVLIRFHVAEDGSITNFKVVQSAGAVFDNEVIRVLKKMPKWSPAMQAGNPVSVSFTQPVTFGGLEE